MTNQRGACGSAQRVEREGDNSLSASPSVLSMMKGALTMVVQGEAYAEGHVGDAEEAD